LDKKGLIMISDAIEELENIVRENSYLTTADSKDGLPYIKITEFGKNFLKMIKEQTA
jgi:predicted transcriptional regulator with HTH domain